MRNIILFHACKIYAEESEEDSQGDDAIECVDSLITAVKDLVTYLKELAMHQC